MKIVGIDPGTAITGYGIIRRTRKGKLEVIDYGVVRTEAELSLPERLMLLYQALAELLSYHRPDGAAVEKLFYQRNVKTAMSVGQARGVGLLALAQAHIPVSEYTPLEVKQAVVGYGRAEKSQVQEMVKALLNMPQIPTPDDAADALAVAICHLHSSSFHDRVEESS
jgi:crossover junction endodeoxyribonuclease RuvC